MSCVREYLQVSGRVQGVGFRPFVYRLAKELSLSGHVCNGPTGVEIEIEGDADHVAQFEQRLINERPNGSEIHDLQRHVQSPIGQAGFAVVASQAEASDGLALIPDRTICTDCCKELMDPGNRRYMYPFTTCIVCGPRYTLADRAPFDRAHTSMNAFPMCLKCRDEYQDPNNRRFHSQTNCCPDCGPSLELLNSQGERLSDGFTALKETVEALAAGKIVAIKSVGGFQLLVDAQSSTAVATLRQRKQREAKPFAVMVQDSKQAEEYVRLSSVERQALNSPEAPIVLLQRESGKKSLVELVAPGLMQYGMMLAPSALHHLLLVLHKSPLVATSGNLSEEPICYRNAEALERLSGVADFFLVHNRDILHRLDDSVVREIDGDLVMLRRARGLYPFALKRAGQSTALAYGAQSKSALALQAEDKLYVGPHLGSLESELGWQSLLDEAKRLPGFHNTQPRMSMCDLHPDYSSMRAAEVSDRKVKKVQHHLAHVLSCVADRAVELPALGVAWDGSGDGGDGTIWGGEFLLVDRYHTAKRFASIYPFCLPGGEVCAYEPRRSALGCLCALHGKDLSSAIPEGLAAQFTKYELNNLLLLLESQKPALAPVCTSGGRLFDAVAALMGLCSKAQYEGQAAMQLEGLALSHASAEEPYSYELIFSGERWLLDFRPMLQALITDQSRGVSLSAMAVRFHLGLSKAIVELAGLSAQKRVILTGGVFQNRFLSEAVAEGLRSQNLVPILHRQIPPNDGGIAVGQLLSQGSVPCV